MPWKPPDFTLNEDFAPAMRTARRTADPISAAPLSRDRRLFCYGTLQIPAVLDAVIGRPLEGGPAVLPGYMACTVRGETYPGLARSGQSHTPGRLYGDVTPPELAVLDRFEGRLYRREARVVVAANGRRVSAWVYMVAAGREAMLTRDPWCLERFLRTGYPRFMQRFVRERRAIYAPSH